MDLAERDSGISTERFRRFFISTAVQTLSAFAFSVGLLFPQSRETLRIVEKVESFFFEMRWTVLYAYVKKKTNLPFSQLYKDITNLQMLLAM